MAARANCVNVKAAAIITQRVINTNPVLDMANSPLVGATILHGVTRVFFMNMVSERKTARA